MNIDKEWFDVLDPAFLNHTPVHWLQFKPQPCSNHFVLAVLYTLILIPGAFGNFVVISLFFRSVFLLAPILPHLSSFFLIIFIFIPSLLVLMKNCRVRSLRNSTNILSLNLAFADLLMNSEIPFFIYNCLKCGPALGVIGQFKNFPSLSRNFSFSLSKLLSLSLSLSWPVNKFMIQRNLLNPLQIPF